MFWTIKFMLNLWLQWISVCVCVCVCVFKSEFICLSSLHYNNNNRSTALTESICCALPTIYLFHFDMQVIHSDNSESRRCEPLSVRLCVCNPVCFCQRVMSVMGRASYLYASQSAIETYKWTQCWFSASEHSCHPLIALIKAVMSTGWLINAVTSPQLAAPFYTLTKERFLTPSQVISMREPHPGAIKCLFSC